AAARHSKPAGSRTSAGQSLETPSQLSAMSHDPAAGRQTAVLFWSAGQAPSEPVQNSAASQAPAAARHWEVEGLKASAGQAALVPVQNSATSHGPAAPRHIVVEGSIRQLEEQQSPSSRLPSSHSSPASRWPLPQHAPAMVASTMFMMASERRAWSLMLPSVPP